MILAVIRVMLSSVALSSAITQGCARYELRSLMGLPSTEDSGTAPPLAAILAERRSEWRADRRAVEESVSLRAAIDPRCGAGGLGIHTSGIQASISEPALGRGQRNFE